MKETAINPIDLIARMGSAARKATGEIARLPAERKSEALMAGAAAIRTFSASILDANASDLERGKSNGLSEAMLDRLALDENRLAAMAAGVEAVAALSDPVGALIDERKRPNGLKLSRIRVPLGVVGIIYESRPNVTADAAALCLKSGNAVILRGGSEASKSNHAIHAALIKGLEHSGVPVDAVQIVPTTDRAVVGAMLTAHDVIDVIIPRGGKTLVSRVQSDARVPVLAHLDGICHTYIDAAADGAKAKAIVVNAKMRRTGVCGATETLLIDQGYAEPGALLDALIDAGCALRGDATTLAIEPRACAATEADWETEYLDSICAVRFVNGVEGAIAHIASHGSNHTDAIITEDPGAAELFLSAVDSAIVMHNASTQFADGGEFGLGAEIGIATGRLHARGPVALEGLTTYKWIVRGTGQIRP
jgi:glutamate-5-semialdehyde dehydrogenase